MKSHKLTLLLLGRAVFAQQNVDVPRAIEPTASGQIGVNPAPLQSDIIQTKTDVVSGTTQIATNTVQIAVATATAASEGVEVGDLSVVLSPAAISTLENIFTSAASTCAAAARLRRKAGAIAVCSAKFIQKAVSASNIIKSVTGSGIEIAKDGGAANLLEYLGLINSAKNAAGAIAAAGAFASEVLTALMAIMSAEAFSLISGILMISYVVWLRYDTISTGFRLPKWITEPKAVVSGPTATIPTATIQTTTSTETYSYLRSQFMTDYFNPMATPLDTPLADAVANLLERRFSELKAKATPIPSGPPCIKAVVRNCMAVLEYEETGKPDGPKPCWNTVKIPDDCATPKSMGQMPDIGAILPKPAAYREGNCHVYVKQFDNTMRKNKDGKDSTGGWGSTYSVTVLINEAPGPGNARGKIIGSQPERISAGPANHVSQEDTQPLELKSLLEDTMIIIPLKNGNNGKKAPHIRFTVGGQTWSSNLQEPPNDARVHCDTDKQEWRWEESSGFFHSNWEYFREINCDFQCKWGGGESSSV